MSHWTYDYSSCPFSLSMNYVFLRNVWTIVINKSIQVISKLLLSLGSQAVTLVIPLAYVLVIFSHTSSKRPLNLAAMFFCAPAQKRKTGNTSSQYWVLQYLGNFQYLWIEQSSTSLQLKHGRISIKLFELKMWWRLKLICFFINVCKFVLCIASWKLQRLIAQ